MRWFRYTWADAIREAHIRRTRWLAQIFAASGVITRSDRVLSPESKVRQRFA